MSASDPILVTGARGFIGAWVVKGLLADGSRVVALDPDLRSPRFDQVLEVDSREQLVAVEGDITNQAGILDTIKAHDVGSVIHLGALQVPACAADPSRGALVNVVGTANVFRAARDAGLTGPVVYASSIAAVPPSAGEHPTTVYGVFKRANEGTAAIMWRDEGVASVGLRPHTVYGVGRDQGLTSAPTKAMLHAAAGLPFHIPFGGSFQMQYAPDVAAAFIAANRSGYQGAVVLNFPTPAVDVDRVVAAIAAVIPASEGAITHDEAPLPFPAQPEPGPIAEILGPLETTSLQDGVADTIDHFRRLLVQGRIRPE